MKIATKVSDILGQNGNIPTKKTSPIRSTLCWIGSDPARFGRKPIVLVGCF